MTLPAIELQMLYGRLAWAVVLAAMGILLLSRRFAVSRAGVMAVAGGAAILSCLPGQWTPVHWLGLAFQAPSAMSAGLCLIVLLGQRPRAASKLLPTGAASVVLLSGALLYLDASGWISIGLYFAGFSAVGAPVVALALSVLGMAGIASGWWRRPAMALFGAVLAFMVLRLPTGNLWDALIDPFLWVFAFAVVVRALRSRLSVPSRSTLAADCASEQAS